MSTPRIVDDDAASIAARICCAAIAITMTGPIRATPSQHRKANEVCVQFIDSATGFTLSPRNIVIDDAATTAKLATKIGSPPCTLVSIGRHTVKARGYHDLELFLSSGNNSSGSADTYLAPVVLPPELSADRVSNLVQPNVTLINGFVSAAATGEPLPDVLVRTTDRPAIQTATNGRGFFTLNVPTNPQSNEAQHTALLFERTGYVTEVRNNIQLAKRDAITYRLRMAQGSGSHVVDDRRRD